MKTTNILYKSSVPVTEQISIMIPTVGEILDNEDAYYQTVTLITAMPIDLMVQLDDIGIDFSEINEYELFLMLFGELRESDTSMIFGDLDLKGFELVEEDGKPYLLNKSTGVQINRAVHAAIADTLRKIHHFEKNTKKPANAAARNFMIERARTKMKRNKNRRRDSQLEELIVAMVNAEQYKYGFEGTRELSIYQFNASVRQVIKKVDYDNKMRGVYFGTVDAQKLSQNELNWLSNK